MAPSSPSADSSDSDNSSTIGVSAQPGRPTTRYANSLTGVPDSELDTALTLDIDEVPLVNPPDPDNELRDASLDIDAITLPVDMIAEAYIGDYKRDPTRQVIPIVPGTAPTCTDLRKRYNDLLAEGMDVFLEAWMRENMGYGILNLGLHLKWKPVQAALDMILVTLDRDIRKAILAGDLPKRARTNHPDFNELRTALRVHRMQAGEKSRLQPIIYANFLVSPRTGLAPTYAQMALVTKYLGVYTKNNTTACKIDRLVDPNYSEARVKSGYRYFIRVATPAGQTTASVSPSPERGRVLEAFTYALERRMTLEKTDSNKNEPMPVPLSEWGFTVKSAEREQQHRNYSSSNWLMNLTETICQLAFPDEYQMKYYPLYCIPFQELAGLAEHFLTTLGQGYVANAGGFSHEPAGRSISGVNKLTRQQAVDVERWVRIHIPVKSNIERLHRSMKKRVESAEEDEVRKESRIKDIKDAADGYLEMREKVCSALDEVALRKQGEIDKYREDMKRTEEWVDKLRSAVDQQKKDGTTS